ncbi:hypothetical protein PR048_028748 [Dryococelus australis]|uniref:Uncharacterized protein n=1 Tax=Dryococelus australis TaxID=614101 RepID=A0ABQ9GBD9_9NEOP|nr:hypothetical protein PR048_028748 [Dryococelus australis]
MPLRASPLRLRLGLVIKMGASIAAIAGLSGAMAERRRVDNQGRAMRPWWWRTELSHPPDRCQPFLCNTGKRVVNAIPSTVLEALQMEGNRKLKKKRAFRLVREIELYETDLTNSQCDNRAEHLPRRRHRGTSPRPSDYKSATLPLSYAGRASIHLQLSLENQKVIVAWTTLTTAETIIFLLQWQGKLRVESALFVPVTRSQREYPDLVHFILTGTLPRCSTLTITSELRLLASRLCGSPPGFSHVGIVPDDAAGVEPTDNYTRYETRTVDRLVLRSHCSPGEEPTIITRVIRRGQWIVSFYEVTPHHARNPQITTLYETRIVDLFVLRSHLSPGEEPTDNFKLWRISSMSLLISCRIEVSLEQRRNARAKGDKGDPRENPLTSGIVRNDCHMRKSGSDPAGNVTRFA